MIGVVAASAVVPWAADCYCARFGTIGAGIVVAAINLSGWLVSYRNTAAPSARCTLKLGCGRCLARLPSSS